MMPHQRDDSSDEESVMDVRQQPHISYFGGGARNFHIDHFARNSVGILDIQTWGHYDRMWNCYSLRGRGLINWIYFISHRNRYQSFRQFFFSHVRDGLVENIDFVIDNEQKAIMLARCLYYNIVSIQYL